MFASAVSFLSLLAQAAAATPAASPAGQAQPATAPAFASFVPMLLIGVIFYFILLRPQQKRAREQASLVSAVRSGDEIVTSGGLHGIVSNAREASSKTVLVKFAENVKIEVDRSAITTVIKPETASAASDARVPAGQKG